MSCIFIINKGIFPYTISFIGDKMTYDKTIGYDDFDIQNEVQKLQMLFILQKFTFFFGLNGIISLKKIIIKSLSNSVPVVKIIFPTARMCSNTNITNKSILKTCPETINIDTETDHSHY